MYGENECDMCLIAVKFAKASGILRASNKYCIVLFSIVM